MALERPKGAMLMLALCALCGICAHVAAFTAPTQPSGAYLFESFQKSPLKDIGWIHSSKDKYTGEFTVGGGEKPLLEGDTGLYVPNPARHYAVAKSVEIAAPAKNSEFVVQYSLRYDDFSTCGGAYLKLIKGAFDKPHEFDSEVPYSIMFGPDKCGNSGKVHLIIQQENKKTGQLVEHHLVDPPHPPSDRDLHLYTLVIFPNQTYSISVDRKEKKAGELAKDFEPPFQPAQEISDPDDKKPADWVDQKLIADPKASKPDDWDEDAPPRIADPDDKKPEGWLDNEPELIDDPEASKPADWDDEEDGQWVPTKIDNPKCLEVGCGEWKPKMIDNPKYKGKWSAPLIDNPAYKGEWEPKRIKNPNYYKVERVELLPIAGVGVEIWTMDKGFTFDNILLANNTEAAAAVTKESYELQKEVEEERKKHHMDDVAQKDDFDDADADADGAADDIPVGDLADSDFEQVGEYDANDDREEKLEL